MRRRDLHALADVGETAPGQAYAHAVDRLEGVEAAAVQTLAPAELLKNARGDRGTALRRFQVLDEDLDRAADADQRHRFA